MAALETKGKSAGVGAAKYDPTKEPRILQDAPPPWHTSATIALLVAYFTAMIPHVLETMDDVAKKQTFVHVNFPNLLTVSQMACLRLVLGAVMVADTLYAVLYGQWEQDTEYYYPYSRLKVVNRIEFRGYMYTGSVVSALSKDACMHAKQIHYC